VEPERPAARFEGLDHWASVVDASLASVVALLVCVAVPPVFRWPVVGLGLLAVGLALGARYRVEIGPAGVHLVTLKAWLIPVRTQRWLLDVKLDVYQSFEADAPEGLCFTPVRFDEGEAESDCFGPQAEARIAALKLVLGQALDKERRATAQRASPLRCTQLAVEPQLAHPEWDARQRLRHARLAAPARVGQLELPAGTALDFNVEPWLDPRRGDRLSSATLGTPLTLPGGLRVPEGTRLSFDVKGRVVAVRGALGPVELEGFWVDGALPLGFDEAGLKGFTLARPASLGGVTVPAGSSFNRWAILSSRKPAWHVRLADTVVLPEFQARAGDTLVFRCDTRALTHASLQQEASLGAERLGPGLVWLDPTGRVQRRPARRAGVLRR
jgi:hypothetical protein